MTAKEYEVVREIQNLCKNNQKRDVSIREIETDAVVETGVGQRLDLNLAEVADLEQLPGLGATLARRIIRWRRDHGGFTSVDQLLEVNGIGASKLEAIRDYITVGGE